jgi:hypothetical protein
VRRVRRPGDRALLVAPAAQHNSHQDEDDARD